MCRSCNAKDQHIADLKEHIEYLRLQAGTPLMPRGRVAGPIMEPEYPSFEEIPWISEEEEEIRALKQVGLIDASQAEAALQAVGALSSEVSMS